MVTKVWGAIQIESLVAPKSLGLPTPFGQRVHDVEPGVLENDPGRQSAHSTAPLAPADPGMQRQSFMVLAPREIVVV